MDRPRDNPSQNCMKECDDIDCVPDMFSRDRFTTSFPMAMAMWLLSWIRSSFPIQLALRSRLLRFFFPLFLPCMQVIGC
jgi:hypothetical protein